MNELLFTPERTVFSEGNISQKKGVIHTKKKALEELSHLMSMSLSVLKYTHILNALQQREKLGSTAIGHGIAIPHARMENIDQPACVLLVLAESIDFSSTSVDIFLALIVPEQYNEEHLHILARISAILSKADFRAELRQTKNSERLYRSIIRAWNAKN